MIKRKGKPIVQIFQFYYWFALGCGIFSTTILAILVYFKRNLQYNPETFDGYTLNMGTNLLIFLLIYTTIGIVVQWMWSHYGIEIKDDRLVYNHLFFGKEDILYDDIDVSKSKYSFVDGKYEFLRFNTIDILYLVMIGGKEYKFKFYEYIFSLSPLKFLKPKVRELGIKIDHVDLRYRELESVYKQESIYDYINREQNQLNDKICKRKKAKKAKKKAQNKKKRRNN